MHEVSANGNPGLDASLKDLYKGQTEIKKKLDIVFAEIKPDLDRALFWKQAKEMYHTTWLSWCFKTKTRTFITLVAALLTANIFIHPFVETSLTIGAIWVLAKKLMGLF